MSARAALLSSLLLLAACDGGKSGPTIAQAWVRLPAVAGQPGAAYFTVHGGRREVKLVRMESALAAKTEIHQSMTGMGGMATMTPLAGIDIPARGAVTFKPGGYHAMLIGLDPVVTAGTAVPLRFGFADGTTAEAEAKTVKAGEDAPY